MNRFFRLLHVLPIQLDVKVKRYCWDDLANEGEQVASKIVRDDPYQARIFYERLKPIIRVEVEDAFSKNFAVIIKKVTFSYQGRTMQRTFSLYEAIRWFDIPLIRSTFQRPEQLLDLLMAEHFTSPFSLTMEEFKPLARDIKRAEQLKTFFGQHYEGIFDAFVDYASGEDEDEEDNPVRGIEEQQPQWTPLKKKTTVQEPGQTLWDFVSQEPSPMSVLGSLSEPHN